MADFYIVFYVIFNDNEILTEHTLEICLMDIFAQRLRAQRELLGLSQMELAKRADLDSPLISNLESGKRAGLTLAHARRLARALGVSLDNLAGTWEDPAIWDNAEVPQEPLTRGRKRTRAAAARV